jgi:dCTP deaminase
VSFITDTDLDLLLSSSSPPLRGAGKFALSTSGTVENPSQVQPCSIDLRIGDVFLPSGSDSNQLVRANEHSLGVGESIRVSTIESFSLPSDIGALLFAPARVTRRGVLVPDIGHIDPGFDGEIRLTLINVGKCAQKFSHGDVVATVLLFRLSKPVGKQFEQFPGAAEHYSRGLQDVNALSKDFLRVEERAKFCARKEARKVLGSSGWKYTFWHVFAPIVLALAASYFSFLALWNSRLVAAETTLGSLDRTDQMAVRLSEVEAQLREVKRTLPAVGAGATTGSTTVKEGLEAMIEMNGPKASDPQDQKRP